MFPLLCENCVNYQFLLPLPSALLVFQQVRITLFYFFKKLAWHIEWYNVSEPLFKYLLIERLSELHFRINVHRLNKLPTSESPVDELKVHQSFQQQSISPNNTWDQVKLKSRKNPKAERLTQKRFTKYNRCDEGHTNDNATSSTRSNKRGNVWAERGNEKYKIQLFLRQ